MDYTLTTPWLWGANIFPPTVDQDRYYNAGFRVLRSNWCRTESKYCAWPDKKARAFVDSWLARQGTKYITVVADREPMAGSDEESRKAMTTGIVNGTVSARALSAGVHPGSIIEFQNGDENLGSGFPWDAYLMFKGKPRTEIDKVYKSLLQSLTLTWTSGVITGSHLYYYDGLAHTRSQKVGQYVTEAGIISPERNPAVFAKFASILGSFRPHIVCWHEPWPANPGDARAILAGDNFTYDPALYDEWRLRVNAAKPDYPGAMLDLPNLLGAWVKIG